MLHHAHFAIKGEVLTFAAVCSNGSNAQKAPFAKSWLLPYSKHSRGAQRAAGRNPF